MACSPAIRFLTPDIDPRLTTPVEVPPQDASTEGALFETAAANLVALQDANARICGAGEVLGQRIPACGDAEESR